MASITLHFTPALAAARRLGDGAANDRAAIQACFDRAAADRKFAVIPPGTWRVDAGVVLGGGARGLIMQGMIQYTGATNAPATVLTLDLSRFCAAPLITYCAAKGMNHEHRQDG